MQDSTNDWYSVYLGFVGVTFDQDSGEVHQSRFSSGGVNIDGNLAVVTAMQFDYDTSDVRVGFGVMQADSVGAIGASGDPVIVDVSQYSYIRPNTGDKWFIIEYKFTNTDTADTLTGGKALFFADIDVGDSYLDNLTGRVVSKRLVYQYSLNDDYCGFAQIIPDDEPEYGNFDSWFHNGDDAMVDSITLLPQYNVDYDSVAGDYGVYLVTGLGDILPEAHAYVAYAFALGRDSLDLIQQIDAAADIFSQVHIRQIPALDYFELISVYPNPFNAEAYISLSLKRPGVGSIKLYDPLGREVRELYSGYLTLGTHRFRWNGRNNSGVRTAAGIYFIRIEYPDFEAVEKLIFLP